MTFEHCDYLYALHKPAYNYNIIDKVSHDAQNTLSQDSNVKLNGKTFFIQ